MKSFRALAQVLYNLSKEHLEKGGEALPQPFSGAHIVTGKERG